MIVPATKFVIFHCQGPWNEEMIQDLLVDSASRLDPAIKPQIALFTDSLPTYRLAIPKIFGALYRVARKGESGCFPLLRYRISRSLVHAQIVKNRSDRKLGSVGIRYAHGSKKLIAKALESMGHSTPNTSAIECRDDIVCLMNAS